MDETVEKVRKEMQEIAKMRYDSVDDRLLKSYRLMLCKLSDLDSLRAKTKDPSELMARLILKRFYRYVEPESILGAFIGSAIGDALGGPVEFLEDYQIFEKYGPKGITKFEGETGYITDDTQMSIFTLEGLLAADLKYTSPTIDQYVESIYNCYLDWLYTQEKDEKYLTNRTPSSLINLPELNVRRAPGNTCLSALQSGKCGTIDKPINNSKGCGGIMRVAVIALYLYQKGKYSFDDIAMICAKASAITHGHELGYIPSALLGEIICQILSGDNIYEAVTMSVNKVHKLFPNSREKEKLFKLIENATDAYLDCDDSTDDLEVIRQLGSGWVAEETLAIAVYCACKYADNFEDAIVAAVNHSGDSDSTGALTGCLVGLLVGIHNIPKKYTENIEMGVLLQEYSNKMFIKPITD